MVMALGSRKRLDKKKLSYTHRASMKILKPIRDENHPLVPLPHSPTITAAPRGFLLSRSLEKKFS